MFFCSSDCVPRYISWRQSWSPMIQKLQTRVCRRSSFSLFLTWKTLFEWDVRIKETEIQIAMVMPTTTTTTNYHQSKFVLNWCDEFYPLTHSKIFANSFGQKKSSTLMKNEFYFVFSISDWFLAWRYVWKMETNKFIFLFPYCKIEVSLGSVVKYFGAVAKPCPCYSKDLSWILSVTIYFYFFVLKKLYSLIQ